jgi:hypothetical protein
MSNNHILCTWVAEIVTFVFLMIQCSQIVLLRKIVKFYTKLPSGYVHKVCVGHTWISCLDLDPIPRIFHDVFANIPKREKNPKYFSSEMSWYSAYISFNHNFMDGETMGQKYKAILFQVLCLNTDLIPKSISFPDLSVATNSNSLRNVRLVFHGTWGYCLAVPVVLITKEHKQTLSALHFISFEWLFHWHWIFCNNDCSFWSVEFTELDFGMLL